MAQRSIEDRLREEYFDLLPEINRVAYEIKARIEYHLLGLSHRLQRHEQIVVKSRIKGCESSIDARRRRVELPKAEKKSESEPLERVGVFNIDTPEAYSLLSLRDLAGVRVLAFPRSYLADIESELKPLFSDWTSDPVLDEETDDVLAYKHYGYCPEASARVQGEYQIASMLTGLFWEVEHSAIYKPAPNLKGIARSLTMQDRSSKVYGALKAFEDEFERLTSKKDE